MSTTLIYPTICNDATEVVTVGVLAVRRDEDGDDVFESAQITLPLLNTEMRHCKESLQIHIEDLNLIPVDWEIVNLYVVNLEDEEF